MAIQTIDISTNSSTYTGDTPHVAFSKTNDNYQGYPMNHFRQLLAAALLLATIACIDHPAHAQGFPHLEAFATDQGSDKALADPAIQRGLRGLLGEKYAEFSENFDVIAEPRRLADGGYFFEGWRQDLRLDQASAFVATPDGKIYAAFLTPRVRIVTYRSNDAASAGKIHPEIQAWMARFEDVKLDAATVTK